MLEVRDLEKTYDVEHTITQALRGVSFTIDKGEFVSIMGPSGSGKSTLLHILSFLDRPSSGSYKFSGKSMSQMDDRELARVRNKEMGFVFQSFNLLGNATVYENIEIPLVYGDPVAIKDRARLINHALDSVGILEKSATRAGTLSGGQKQRVAIARALVKNPNVIFADEPTGNLDSKSGAQVMEILKNLHASGRTIILVTHETYTARYANRLIKIKDGQVESDEKIAKSGKNSDEFFK